MKVLHRDLKCANIFLAGDGSTLKVGDFGISRVFEFTKDYAETIVGTPYYMSPEVCSQQPYSWKSDVWALGCILYELCALSHAFKHSTLQGLVHAIRNGSYEPIPGVFSEQVSSQIAAVLTVSPEARPSMDQIISSPTVQAYVEMLSQPMEALSMSGRLEFAERPTRKEARRRKSSKVGAAVLLATEVPPMPSLMPQDMSLILASRLRCRLPNDVALPDGGVEVITGHLRGMQVPLSDNEINLFLASLPAAGGVIAASTIQAKLAEAEASPKAAELWAWAKLVLRVETSRFMMTMEARDPERSGTVPLDAFKTALQEIKPDISSEEAMVLSLLSDKNECDDIAYAYCAAALSIEDGSREDTFFTCATDGIKVMANVQQAW
jgi:hypothetical protein